MQTTAFFTKLPQVFNVFNWRYVSWLLNLIIKVIYKMAWNNMAWKDVLVLKHTQNLYTFLLCLFWSIISLLVNDYYLISFFTSISFI